MRMIPADSRFAAATDAASLAPALAMALQQACPGVDWARLTVVRVLPDSGGGFVIQYAAPGADGNDQQLGALLPDPGSPVPDWAIDGRPGRTWLPNPGLAVVAFPHDPDLGNAPALLTESWRRSLAAALGHDPDGADVTALAGSVPGVLGYRLRKRCVLRVALATRPADNGAPASVVVKALRPRRLAALTGAHADFAAPNPGAAAFALPRVLHVDEAHGAVVMEDIRGRTLHAMAGTAGLSRTYAVAGCALREFHRRPTGTGAPRTATDELAHLAGWTRLVGELFPAMADEQARLLDRLADAGNRLHAAPAPVLVHRDFYDKQVIADADRLTLLDLDTATAGDAALDLGNFLAHVRLRQLQSPQHAHALAAAGNAFQEAYGTDHELLTRTSWWRAATTLRLAALYALRPRWRSLSPQLLEEVETCLRLPERML
jgi:tRNA A-37 threonylcarbamoyl transferase component Bud32